MLALGRISLCLALTLLCFGAVRAQTRPQAIVKADSAASGDKRYYIDILTDTPLKQSEYDALRSAKPPVLGVLASKGVPIADVGPIQSAGDNDRTHFRIYLNEAFRPLENFSDKQLSVILINFKDDSNENKIRNIAVVRALSRQTAIDFPLCRPQQLSIRFDYDASSKQRARELYQAFQNLTPAQLGLISIRVEPLSKKTVTTLKVNSLRIYPDSIGALDFNSTLTACFETDKDMPNEKFDAEISWNTPVPPEFAEPRIVEALPGKAPEASPVVFVNNEKGVGLRPIEKDLNIAVSLVSRVADVEQEDKTTKRERGTRGTLDLRIGLLRKATKLSVTFPLKQKICGPVSSFTGATATTNGSITINGVPWVIEAGLSLDNAMVGTEQCLHFVYTDADAAGNSMIVDHNPFHPSDAVFEPYISWLEEPDRTIGTYSVFTPFYLDAKVSTGKIDKETISLNRVVFGIEEEFRYFANNERFPTYYRFILQGNHASDRDFKQKEYKATFEFRPLFGPLNHPYDPSNASSSKRILCPTCKQSFKLIPSNRGFEFVPLIGFEIGRTYSRRNPAPAIEPSDIVKRLYFGLGATLNPTARITLKATEQFYIRGESKEDRYHNYFSGEFSYRLANFYSGRAAHAVFFSWEKGGQPPFAEPDVNVFKIGYRVTATTLFSR